MRAIPTYDPMKKREVVAGYVDGDVFIKKVKFKDHFMRKYGGYGIQEDAFQKLLEEKIKIIRMIVDGHIVYETPIELWEELGETHNEGSGKQRFLDLRKIPNEYISQI